MITYRRELFGLRTLGRFHGSAVAKAQVPALFSTLILILAVYFLDVGVGENDTVRIIIHPYVINVLVVFVTFILTFRANFAYARVRLVITCSCTGMMVLRFVFGLMLPFHHTYSNMS